MLKKIMMIILIMIFIKEYHCEDIFVSMINGTDENLCGTKKKMCKTISYSLEARSVENITLHIDGGETSSTTYTLTQIIKATRVIRIKKFNKCNPIISRRKRSGLPLFAFNITNSNLFVIDSINFQSINVLHIRPSNTKLNQIMKIINSTVTNESEDTYAAIDVVSNSFLSLFVRNCTFYQRKTTNIYVKNENMLVYYKNTTTAGEIKVHCKNCKGFQSQVVIESMTASKNANFQLLGDYSILHVNNSIISNIFIQDYMKPIFKFSSVHDFSRKAIVIENCSFINNTLTSAIIDALSNYDIIIKSSRFRNNVAKYMLYTHSNNHIKLKSCYFTNNYATRDMIKFHFNNKITVIESSFKNNINNDDTIAIILSNHLKIASTLFLNNTARYMLYGRLRNNLTLLNSILIKNNVSFTMLYLNDKNYLKILNTNVIQNSVRHNNMLYGTSQNNITLLQTTITQNNVSRNMLALTDTNYLELLNTTIILNRCSKILYGYLQNNVNILNTTIIQNNVSDNMIILYDINYLELLYANITQNNVDDSILYGESQNNISFLHTIITQNNISRFMLNINNKNYLKLLNTNIVQNSVKYFILTGRLQNNINLLHTAVTENTVTGNILNLRKKNNLKLLNTNIIQNSEHYNIIYGESNNNITLLNTNVIKNSMQQSIIFVLSESKVNLFNTTIAKNNILRAVLVANSNCDVNIEKTNVSYNNFKYFIMAIHKNKLFIKKVYIVNNNVSNSLFSLRQENPSNSTSIKSSFELSNKNDFNLLASYVLKNVIQQDILLSLENENILIKYCLFKENEFRHLIVTKYSKIHIFFCAFIANEVQSVMFNFDQSNTSIILTNITHKANNDNAELIKFNECTHNVSMFQLEDVIVAWSSFIVTHVPLIRINAKASRININRLSINITSLVDKLQISVTSIDPDRYLDVIGSEIIKLHIQCPPSFYPTFSDNKQGIIENFCQPCSPNFYMLLSKQDSFISKIKQITTISTNLHWPHNQIKHVSALTHTNNTNIKATCFPCPIGGKCINSIIGVGNVYGYRSKIDQIEFIQCPPFYCCSKETKPCATFNTCNFNRKGIICGSCNDNFFENYFTTDCTHKSRCKNQTVFWVIYTIFAICTVLILLFITDVKNKLNRLCKDIKTYAPHILCCNVTETTYSTAQVQCSLTEIRIRKNCSSGNIGESSINTILTGNALAESRSNQESYTFSGIFSLLLSYYQIKEILTVGIGRECKTATGFEDVLRRIFNFDVTFNSLSAYCPSDNLNALTKLFMKNILFTLTILTFLTLTALLKVVVTRACSTWHHEHPSKKFVLQSANSQMLRTTFMEKVALCYVRILLFSYKNISMFFIILLHCEKINEQKYLYIFSTVICYNWWQILLAVIFIPWSMLFPLALSISFDLYRLKYISLKEFLVALMFPLYAFILRRRKTISKIGYCITNDTLEELLTLFEEPYKVRQNEDDWFFLWESWRLYERLTLGVAVTYVIEPMLRVCFMGAILLSFIIIYFRVKPYKKNMVLLHWMNIMSLMGFCLLGIFNMLKSVVYVYDIPNSRKLQNVLTAFQWLQHLFTPLIVLLVYFILLPLFNFITTCIKRKQD